MDFSLSRLSSGYKLIQDGEKYGRFKESDLSLNYLPHLISKVYEHGKDTYTKLPEFVPASVFCFSLMTGKTSACFSTTTSIRSTGSHERRQLGTH